MLCSAKPYKKTVADPGLRWGARCKIGARGPKVLFGTYFHTRKVKNWGRGAIGPPGSTTEKNPKIKLPILQEIHIEIAK